MNEKTEKESPPREEEIDMEDLKQAAEQGNAEAQIKLGDCYYKGTGVNKDLIEAVKWYRTAAEQTKEQWNRKHE